MIRRGGFVLCLYVALAMLVGAARALGQTRPIPDSIRQIHLLDCAAPCWMGITPGLTTVSEAKAQIVDNFTDYRGLQIKDVGFMDGPVSKTAVENMIDGEQFYLFIRMNTAELVDGVSETVQSIDLFQPRDDRANYAPTVGEVLGVLGAPQWVMIDDSSREVTLRYNGLDVVFNFFNNRVNFNEIPHFHLGRAENNSDAQNLRRWKGLLTLRP